MSVYKETKNSNRQSANHSAVPAGTNTSSDPTERVGIPPQGNGVPSDTPDEQISSYSINPNLIIVPQDGQAREVYSRFLREMQHYANVYERNLGRFRWMQGVVLNIVRQDIPPGNGWGAFLTSVKISATTAKYCRKIAVAIPEDKSTSMTYHEMLKKLYPSYGKIEDDLVQAEIDQEDAENDGAPTNGALNKTKKTKTHKTDPFTVSQLQRFLRQTASALQGWNDHEITKDVGFDQIETIKKDVANSVEVIQNELVRIQDKVQGIQARKVA
jgi:hypothetical protein